MVDWCFQPNGNCVSDGHGLVTIRMKPDDHGRFGFNVKVPHNFLSSGLAIMLACSFQEESLEFHKGFCCDKSFACTKTK
jgi:hypothetical protein